MEKISLESANILLREKGFEVELTCAERFEIFDKELEENRKGEISDYIDSFSSHLPQKDVAKLFDLVDSIYEVALKMYEYSGEYTFEQYINSAVDQIIEENF